eukprot:TRINITY_DN11151_c0_g1_i4.p1 TRINITY_DN11151_c0_g1~~TRINITY_DN11151_c0_g1_i4.p1  ORF type:complete len:537 (+),score=43.13 TRINITY_DN11151_c0_g1_i4:570-2180(+)
MSNEELQTKLRKANQKVVGPGSYDPVPIQKHTAASTFGPPSNREKLVKSDSPGPQSYTPHPPSFARTPFTMVLPVHITQPLTAVPQTDDHVGPGTYQIASSTFTTAATPRRHRRSSAPPRESPPIDTPSPSQYTPKFNASSKHSQAPCYSFDLMTPRERRRADGTKETLAIPLPANKTGARKSIDISEQTPRGREIVRLKKQAERYEKELITKANQARLQQQHQEKRDLVIHKEQVRHHKAMIRQHLQSQQQLKTIWLSVYTFFRHLILLKTRFAKHRVTEMLAQARAHTVKVLFRSLRCWITNYRNRKAKRALRTIQKAVRMWYQSRIHRRRFLAANRLIHFILEYGQPRFTVLVKQYRWYILKLQRFWFKFIGVRRARLSLLRRLLMLEVENVLRIQGKSSGSAAENKPVPSRARSIKPASLMESAPPPPPPPKQGQYRFTVTNKVGRPALEIVSPANLAALLASFPGYRIPEEYKSQIVETFYKTIQIEFQKYRVKVAAGLLKPTGEVRWFDFVNSWHPREWIYSGLRYCLNS